MKIAPSILRTNRTIYLQKLLSKLIFLFDGYYFESWINTKQGRRDNIVLNGVSTKDLNQISYFSKKDRGKRFSISWERKISKIIGRGKRSFPLSVDENLLCFSASCRRLRPIQRKKERGGKNGWGERERERGTEFSSHVCVAGKESWSREPWIPSSPVIA